METVLVALTTARRNSVPILTKECVHTHSHKPTMVFRVWNNDCMSQFQRFRDDTLHKTNKYYRLKIITVFHTASGG